MHTCVGSGEMCKEENEGRNQNINEHRTLLLASLGCVGLGDSHSLKYNSCPGMGTGPANYILGTGSGTARFMPGFHPLALML